MDKFQDEILQNKRDRMRSIDYMFKSGDDLLKAYIDKTNQRKDLKQVLGKDVKQKISKEFEILKSKVEDSFNHMDDIIKSTTTIPYEVIKIKDMFDLRRYTYNQIYTDVSNRLNMLEFNNLSKSLENDLGDMILLSDVSKGIKDDDTYNFTPQLIKQLGL